MVGMTSIHGIKDSRERERGGENALASKREREYTLDYRREAEQEEFH